MNDFLIGLGIFVLAIVLSIIFTYPTMLLWNYLMPMIFGLPKLTFWQIFGLQVLVNCFIPHYTSSNTKK